jgi:hypothetical protein
LLEQALLAIEAFWGGFVPPPRVNPTRNPIPTAPASMSTVPHTPRCGPARAVARDGAPGLVSFGVVARGHQHVEGGWRGRQPGGIVTAPARWSSARPWPSRKRRQGCRPSRAVPRARIPRGDLQPLEPRQFNTLNLIVFTPSGVSGTPGAISEHFHYFAAGAIRAEASLLGRSLARLCPGFGRYRSAEGFVPGGGKDIFQKFAGGARNANDTMVFPLPASRRDTTRHSAFCLLCSLTRMSVVPTDTETSRTVSPPCPLTERERVRILNLSFCSLIPCTVKSAKTDRRAVRRRSPFRH